jgi:hypothetical protein
MLGQDFRTDQLTHRNFQLPLGGAGSDQRTPWKRPKSASKLTIVA